MDNNTNKEEFSINKAINIPIFFASFSFSIILFILPIYSKSIGANAFEIGLLFSVFSLVNLLIRPLIGIAIDKYGGKTFFVFSLIFYVLSMFLFSRATNMNWLYIARIFQGIGSSILWITAYTLTANMSSKEDKGKYLGVINEFSSKGSLNGAIVGFILLGMMTLAEGWKVIFLCYAVAAAYGAIIAWKRLPSEKIIRITDKKNVISREFKKIIIIIFLGSLASSILDPILIIYLQDKFTTDVGTLAIASIPVAIIISTLPSKTGKWSDKVGRIKPLVLGFFICGVSTFFIIIAFNIYMLVVFWAINAVGIALILPAEQAVVSDMIGENFRGTGFGIYMFAIGIGSTIGRILGGLLYDKISHATPFIVCGTILVVASFLTILVFSGSFYKRKLVDKIN